jgi:hypothetical protein
MDSSSGRSPISNGRAKDTADRARQLAKRTQKERVLLLPDLLESQFEKLANEGATDGLGGPDERALLLIFGLPMAQRLARCWPAHSGLANALFFETLAIRKGRVPSPPEVLELPAQKLGPRSPKLPISLPRLATAAATANLPSCKQASLPLNLRRAGPDRFAGRRAG